MKDVPQYAPYRQPLVGRTAEQEALHGWLCGVEPVVASVVGPAGVGKTHLAVVVARQAAADIGAELISLRLDNQTSESLPAYLAMRLGAAGIVNEAEPNLPPANRRKLVVLFDNCDTVLDDVALTIDRLDCVPGLHIIATSQIPLNLSAEKIVWLQPLSVENGGEDGASDAVQMFAHLARSARADFKVKPANIDTINAIVHELNGWPLAIVLAAAHVRHLSLDALLAHLREDITILNAGPADVPTRHRSLHSAFATSLASLDERQQDLLLMLSWYRSGFDADDVQALLPELKRGQGRDLLEQLADRSLIRTYPDERFGMPHIIQAMAHQLAVQRPGLASHAREVHRAMLVRVVAKAKAQMHGPNELLSRRRLHELLPDVMSTWNDPDPAVALQLIADMQWFWYTGAMFGSVLPGLEDVVTRGKGLPAEAGAHLTVGWMWHHLARVDRAQRHFEEALRLAPAEDPNAKVATIGLAQCLAFEGENIGQSIQMLDTVIESFADESAATHELLATWFVKGLMTQAAGDVGVAQSCYLYTLDRARDVDDFHAVGMCLMQLATINLSAGEVEPALWKLQEAIPQILAGGDLATVTLALDILATTLKAMGQPDRAALALAHGDRLRDRLGVMRSPTERQDDANLRVGLPDLPHVSGDIATEQILELLATNPDKQVYDLITASLTPRELDVLELTARGYRGAEIAGQLLISTNTVKRHMANIRTKLGVKSQAAAIATIRELSRADVPM